MNKLLNVINDRLEQDDLLKKDEITGKQIKLTLQDLDDFIIHKADIKNFARELDKELVATDKGTVAR